ncbi:MAG: leucine-rich repeat domain-containing protein, partial [Lachnospiraceae bacterium]|nr:leucine-rich repeat domain-containing protein [Lachnospiraceae bacterium]
MANTNGKKPNTTAKKKKRASKRAMRRSVMGTVSVLLMLTAVIVALIPVPKAAALSTDEYDAYTADKSTKFLTAASATVTSVLPAYNTESYPVYASGDGMLRVAMGKSGGIDSGIIVGYNNASSMSATGNIEISEEMPAYRFNTSIGGYVAVDASNNYLFYESQSFSDGGTQVFSPCTYQDEGAWSAYGTPLYHNSKNKMSDVLSQVTNTVSGNMPAELIASSQLMIPINYIGDNNMVYVIDTGKTGDNAAWPDGDYMTPSDDNPGVFEGVTNVSSISFPDTVYAIGDRAFKGCNALGSVAFGNGMRSIGNEAFAQCRALSTANFAIPSNLREIGDEAFSECSNLTSVTIPKSVSKLGNFCFYDCEKLSAVNLNGGGQADGSDSNLSTVGHGLFYNCYALTQLQIPPLTQIGGCHLTCYGCRALTSLSLPSHATGTWDHDNVTGCYSLNYVMCESANLDFECPTSGSSDICDQSDDLTETFGKNNLGQGSPDGDAYEVKDDFVIMAFYDSKAEKYTRRHDALAFGYLDNDNAGKYRKYVDGYFYTVDTDGNLVGFTKADPSNNGYNVLIPEKIGPYTVKRIDGSTFAENTDIRYLNVPSTVTDIAQGAFFNCENLRNVNFEYTDGVTVGDGAFATNANKSVVDEGGLRFFGQIGGSNEQNPYYYAMNTGSYNNIQQAPADNINFCTPFPDELEVENVEGKATLVGIPTYERLQNTYETFKKYFANTTPPSSGEIEGLLSDSKNLYSLSCYVSSEDDMNQEFEHAFYRENMAAAKAFAKQEGYLAEEMTGEEQQIIDSIYHVNVPAGVDYLKGGDDPLFEGNAYVQSVTLNSVKEIPDNEFKDCTALTTFEMLHNGEGDYAESIGLHAFENDTTLTSVSIPSTMSYIKREKNPATGVEDGAALPFAGCTSLKDVDFGSSPYYDCQDAIIYKLDTSGNPDAVVEVLETRGKSGAGRSNVVVPAVNEIYPKAFSNCKEISSVDLLDTTIDKIPAGCFTNAENLTTAKLPETVSFITSDAFDNTDVGEVYVYGDDTSLQWIDNMHDKNVVIYGHVNSSAHKFVQQEELRDPETKYEFAELPSVTFKVYYHDCDPTKDVTDQNNWRALPPEEVPKGSPSARYDTYIDLLDQWPGYKFSRWDQEDALKNGVNHDIYTVALYEKSNTYAGEGQCTVTIQDEDLGSNPNAHDYHVVVDEGTMFGEANLPKVIVPREGYKSYYDPDISSNPLKIDDDTTILIRYYPDPDYVAPKDPEPETPDVYHKVTFKVDDLTFSSQWVKHGEYPEEETEVPRKSGYTFVYWTPTNYMKQVVTEDVTVTANFEKNTVTADVDGSDDISGSTGNTSGTGGDVGGSGKKKGG